MRGMMLAVWMALLSVPAFAGPIAIGNEIPTADQAPDKAEAETVDGAKEAEPFKVPPGYQVKTRGKKVVYCKKAAESGTRFAQEKCYSEETLRAMDAASKEEQTSLDQTRKVCATVESCASQ
jgi:hypothetical protein